MNRRASTSPARRARQRGFALPSAIFLLVILTALAAFMVHFSTTQSVTSAQDVQGSRAYQAARAGTEWALYKVLDPLNATVVAPGDTAWPNLPTCPTPTVLTIEGFSVQVKCTPYDYLEGGGDRSIRVFLVESTASTGVVGTLGFVERKVVVSASKCRARDGATVDHYACP
jgi:MSHA biogenesis protein MshP